MNKSKVNIGSASLVGVEVYTKSGGSGLLFWLEAIDTPTELHYTNHEGHSLVW